MQYQMKNACDRRGRLVGRSGNSPIEKAARLRHRFLRSGTSANNPHIPSAATGGIRYLQREPHLWHTPFSRVQIGPTVELNLGNEFRGNIEYRKRRLQVIAVAHWNCVPKAFSAEMRHSSILVGCCLR